MSSPIPSTSDGGGGAPELSQEDLDKMIMDNNSDSEEEVAEYAEPSMSEMMDKVNDKVDDSWSDKKALEAFAEKMKEKDKERDEKIAADQAKYDAEEKAENEKVEAKKIKYVAPGLDLFTEKFFAHFSAKDLSLEKDFSYTQKRERLKELGIDEETISQVMENRLKFLAYLMPEACSALISTEADFDRICNFLFFCASSCLDQTEYELLTQALFELLKNYEYKWKLRLLHIFTVLENLGMNSELLFDKDEVLSEALQTRLELVKRMNAAIGRKDRKLWPPKSHAFVESRRKRNGEASEGAINYTSYFVEGDPYIDPTEAQRLGCIKNCVVLICDLIIDMRDNTVFQTVGDDWINQLTLIYLIGLLGTDKHLTNDAIVTSKICLLLHDQLDSFTPFAWTGIQGADGQKFLDQSGNDKMNNACCDVSEVLSMIMNNVSEDNKVRTWKPSDLPASKDFALLDHHHNMVRRLQLLPLSARGNQIKRNVAYLYLQHMLKADLKEEEDRLTLYPRADISDVMNLLEDTNVRANFKTYGTSEYYVMMSMIRLIDMITGSEREDYKPELVEKQKKMHTLLQDISKRLADDVRNVDPSMVKEIVAQVTARWTIMQRKFANDSAGFITGSIEGTRMKRKNAAKS